MRRLHATAPLFLVTVAAVLAGCGGSGSSPSTNPSASTPAGQTSSTPAATASAPADVTAAKAEITRVWTTFFHTGTSHAKAKTLLEDGSSLGAALKIATREDKQSHLDRNATVKFITFLDPATANVNWTLLNGTNPVLNNASGQAKLVGGQWKVSKLTFCTLVELGNNGKPVPGCSS